MIKVRASHGSSPPSKKIFRLSKAHSLSESLNSYCKAKGAWLCVGGRRHTGRGGVVCYLDVPAQRTKLLPLLNDGMEEAQSKYKFAPHHSKDCSMKGEAVGEYCVCVCVCVCVHPCTCTCACMCTCVYKLSCSNALYVDIIC